MVIYRRLKAQGRRNFIDICSLINHYIIFFNNMTHPLFFQQTIFFYGKIIKDAFHNLFLGIGPKMLRQKS